MGRGVSAGGGQSSLGYLFGSGETTNKAQVDQKETTNNAQVAQNQGPAANSGPSQKPAAASPPIDKETPAGVPGHLTNNYFRAEGQNCGNFITV
jgi:SPIRAL1-like protein